MKHDLSDVTFIIPVKLESQHRMNNTRLTLSYLKENFNTNVIIHEMGHLSRAPDPAPDKKKKRGRPKKKTVEYEEVPLIPDLLKELGVSKSGNWSHEFITGYKSSSISDHEVAPQNFEEEASVELGDLVPVPFHRTKMLNEMLNKVTTPITVNYDIDIILPQSSYVTAATKIAKEGYDLVYPFGLGMWEKQIPSETVQSLMDNLHKSGAANLDSELVKEYIPLNETFVGHCQFLNTDSYRKFGMENENFVSWGPEDKERYYRFQKLGGKVTHLGQGHVFHLEHARLADSDLTNREYGNNIIQYVNILKMTPQQTLLYYQRAPYLKKYNGGNN